MQPLRRRGGKNCSMLDWRGSIPFLLLIEVLCFEPFRPHDQLSWTLQLAGHSSRSSKLRHSPPRHAREHDNCNGHTSEPERESRTQNCRKSVAVHSRQQRTSCRNRFHILHSAL